MTKENEEAIKQLKELQDKIALLYPTQKAIDFAIKALEQQRNLTNEELYQSFIKLEAENERLHDALEAQPKTGYISIDVNKFAKEVAEKALDEITYEGKTIREWAEILVKQQPSEDCISRQAGLDVIDFEDEWLFDAKSHNADTKIAFSAIKSKISDLPPVTPRRPKGKWVYTSKRRLIDETDEGCVYITDYRCTCSECGSDFGFQKMSDAYCKYCGSYNGGNDNGDE